MIIDFHCDTVMKLYFKEKSGLAKNKFHVDIEKLKKAECAAQFFALFIEMESSRKKGKKTWDVAMDMKDIFYREIEKNSGDIALARSYDEYVKNREADKISAFLTVEEGGIIGNDINKVKELYDYGVRLITLVWNYQNSIGNPAAIDQELGLTSFGFEVVEMMEHLGMIIDISHLSDRGVEDLMGICKKPFIASHSNSREICNVRRNLLDCHIKEIGNRGGIIGINYAPDFVTPEGKSTVNGLIKHISHIINKGGEEVIALGSDFDGIRGSLEMANVGETYKLIDGLRKKGYSERIIEKILFRNGERIIKELL